MAINTNSVKSLFAVLLFTACAHVPVGVPVVFVHGNGGNAKQWRAQIAHLPSAIAIELPGMGQRPAPSNGDYSIAAMAEDIDRQVRGIPRFVIVGHSYGGAVAAMYAAKHPERVAGIVYADSAGIVKISDEA